MLNTLVIIIILIACILLIGAVLIQNPKGGGLSQSFGGFSNQIMGVQRTTDFLEKATWVLIAVVAVLSLSTTFLKDKPQTGTNQVQRSRLENAGNAITPPAPAPGPAPANNGGNKAPAPAPAK